jgi:hypothetical protein
MIGVGELLQPESSMRAKKFPLQNRPSFRARKMDFMADIVAILLKWGKIELVGESGRDSI